MSETLFRVGESLADGALLDRFESEINFMFLVERGLIRVEA